MKKTVIVAAVAALALASAAAYGQMQYPRANSTAPTNQGHGPMMGRGHMMQGQMGQGHMGQGMRHGGAAGGHGEHADRPKGDSGPSSLAFQGINMKMHEAMDIAFTGNADIDFVNGMIPHHEGAVEMARRVLAFGKDAEIRKLAEAVVKAQESEIALMKEWLRKNAQ